MTDAVVVGAGIGGLATAALLQRLGHRTLVVEQRAEGEGVGAGILLQPNGLAVLGALGVVDGLRKQGSEVRHLRLLDEQLRPVSEIALPGGPIHGFGLVVPRAELHEVLVGVARSAGVEFSYARRLREVTGDVGNPVLVFDGEATRPTRLLVGADGQGSVVRRYVDPTGPTPTEGRSYLRALVDWDCVEPLRGEYWTRKGIAGIFACGAKQTYWYCTATPRVAQAAEGGDLNELRRRVAAAHPPLIQAVNALESLDQVRVDRVVDVQAGQLYRGVAVLIGDAAHAMAPNLGQGANSALLDAGVLACELYRRHGVGEALAAYDARRSEAVRRVQLDANRLARLSHFTRARGLRRMALRMMPARVATAAVQRSQQVDLAAFRHELHALPD